MAPEVEPEPEPEPEPANDPAAMEGTAASADAIMKAISDSPDLVKVISDIQASVEDGSYQTKYQEGTPERSLADELAKNMETTVDYVSKATGLDLTGPKPFDQSTPTGAKNSDGFIARIKKVFGFKEKVDVNDDGSLTKSGQDKLAKKTAEFEKKASEEPNSKSALALKILELLGPIVPALLSAWKLNQLEDFLEKLAQSLNECDEVNYSKRTQIRLKCDTNNPQLKTNCACSGAGAPALQGICSTFDPTHTCPDYDYVYFEYHWYDLFAAVVHGGEDVATGIWAWLTSHKWSIGIGIIVFILLLTAIGIARRYASD